MFAARRIDGGVITSISKIQTRDLQNFPHIQMPQTSQTHISAKAMHNLQVAVVNINNPEMKHFCHRETRGGIHSILNCVAK